MGDMPYLCTRFRLIIPFTGLYLEPEKSLRFSQAFFMWVSKKGSQTAKTRS